MKIIKNKLIPFGRYKAINIFGLIFTKSDLSEQVKNHENIHTKQMKYLLYLPFYLIYGIEWLIKLIKYRNCHKAYRNISFEREAYAHEKDLNYIKIRTPYNQWNRL